MVTETTPPIIQAQLQPGEELIWYARPAQGRKFHPDEIIQMFFGGLWTAFSLALQVGFGVMSSAPELGNSRLETAFHYVFLTPFTAIGVWLIGTQIAEMKKRARSFYAITNQRVFTLVEEPEVTVDSVPLEQLGKMNPQIWQGGVGYIGFKVRRDSAGTLSTWTDPDDGTELGFRLVEDCRRVFGILEDARGARRNQVATVVP